MPVVPRSVAELADQYSWRVTTGVRGQWITAEWGFEHSGTTWLIGLTPVTPTTIALILWSGDTVVDHARGTESAMCSTAHRWKTAIIAGHRWTRCCLVSNPR
jgi:hypothetical protein